MQRGDDLKRKGGGTALGRGLSIGGDTWDDSTVQSLKTLARTGLGRNTRLGGAKFKGVENARGFFLQLWR